MLFDAGCSDAQIRSDDVCFREAVVAKVACQHQRPVEKRLRARLVRHRLHVQVHRKVHLHTVAGLPRSRERQIAPRRRGCVEPFAIERQTG